jgi:hypothetical protein
VVTAAGFLGIPDTPLEATRLALWAGRRKPPMPVRPSRVRGGTDGERPRRSAGALLNSRPDLRRAKEA